MKASIKSILRLPLLGKVEIVEPDRGFGFVQLSGHAESRFFHVTASKPRINDLADAIEVGDRICVTIGSDDRHPGRKQAVRWTRVDDIQWGAQSPPENQSEFDALRRELVSSLSLDALGQLMAAGWYQHRWRGQAPADLIDPVLENAFDDCIGKLQQERFDGSKILAYLERSCYAFAVHLIPDNPRASLSHLLKTFTPWQLATLGKPMANWLRQAFAAQIPSVMEWAIRSNVAFEGGEDWMNFLNANEEHQAQVSATLIDNNTGLSEEAWSWIYGVASKGKLIPSHVDRLASLKPMAAATLYLHLSDESKRACLDAWRENPAFFAMMLNQHPAAVGMVAPELAVAVDLETDGQHIWEVGCAQGQHAELLHEGNDAPALASALQALTERICKAVVVVGHNIMAWDWPILSSHLKLETPPVLWDTLLVEYLLEPQARSHALGSNHHADADALATLRLFARQLARCPASLTSQLLLGKFATSEELLAALTDALRAEINLVRVAPSYLPESGKDRPVLLLPQHRMADFDWISGIQIVQANPDESLPESLWQIDEEKLVQELAQAGLRGPGIQILSAVIRQAGRKDIAVRRGMIPAWVKDSVPGLDQAISRACTVSATRNKTCISPLPSDPNWWKEATPEKYAIGVTGDKPLIVERRRIAPAELVESVNGQPHTSLVRMVSQGTDRWLLRDRAASVLELKGGWRTFRTIQTANIRSIVLEPVDRTTTARPVLCARQYPALYPNAVDQDQYWLEVLQSFVEVTESARSTAPMVPILLVTSSASPKLIELLATALSEIAAVELKPTHRSRQEHLRRAAQRNLALVDVIDEWSAWHSIAGSCDVTLLPVIEAVPIEEWFAVANPAWIDDAAQHPVSTPQTAQTNVEINRVKDSSLLAALPNLLLLYLPAWLEETGLAATTTDIWFIDTRAGRHGSQLRKQFGLRRFNEELRSKENQSRLNAALSPLRVEREAAPSGYEPMERFLIEHWQPSSPRAGDPIKGFKPSQKSAMEAISARTNDVLVSLPTGEGKSVLFQVPALCRGLRNRRLTLVISPLKALMKDQVEGLRDHGFAESVDYITSDHAFHEREEIMQGVLNHRIVLLYVAPERLRSPTFVAVLEKRIAVDGGLEHVVVDETHCVNQWGYEFRPDYFNALHYLLARLRAPLRQEQQLASTPFLLLSATVTQLEQERLAALLASYPPSGEPKELLIRPDSFTNPLRSHISIVPHRVHQLINDNKSFAEAVKERLPIIERAVRAARQNTKTTGQRSAVIVFAAWRDQTEKLANLLHQSLGDGVDYYHAGLDAETRNEIYAQFRDGELDVLVATKAFGMGMDIPDIHWVIHLNPPNYLEDYLQEAGRIGRSAEARELAGLTQLRAELIFSNQDFESLRSLQATSSLNKPSIESFRAKLDDHVETFSAKNLVFVPAHGYEPYSNDAEKRRNSTATIMSLYWLERAGSVLLQASVENLLKTSFDISRLQSVASEETLLAPVAQTILTLCDPSPEGVNAQGNSLGSTAPSFGWRNALGVALTSTEPSAALLNHDATKNANSLALNLSRIQAHCNIESMDKVLSTIAELEHRGALSTDWTLAFALRPLAREPNERLEALFTAVSGAVTQVLGLLTTKTTANFQPYDLLDTAWTITVSDDSPDNEKAKKIQRLIRHYDRAYLHGFRSLARSAGIRMRQIVTSQNVLTWEATLPATKQADTLDRCTFLMQGTRGLFTFLREKIASEVNIAPISDLIQNLREVQPKGLFYRADLNAVLRLLAAMRLFSTSRELLPVSHIVELLAPCSELQCQTKLWEELEHVNVLADLRMQAMEIFANIPAYARDSFIEGYFAQTSFKELPAFLDTQLGEIDTEDANISTFIQNKREHLRQEKIIEFFNKYKSSPESSQWKAIGHPFDQHLLVNAGPGSGKTSVLIARIAHLIHEQKIKPNEIIVLAFNRAVVFEIKRRIKELFSSLGYSSYVRGIRVSTFHSLATRSIAKAGAMDPEAGTADILRVFAEQLRQDGNFREQVAGNCRCILVDEYQDATTDVYTIIRQLYNGSGARAGVMVIGDDDQDILRWHRRANREEFEFSDKYFHQFAQEFSDKLTSLEFVVNFRSGKNIIDLSQKAIKGTLDGNKYTFRLKQKRLQPPPDIDCKSYTERYKWTQKSWSDALEKAKDLLLKGNRSGSFAILCRSNAEVAKVHYYLNKFIPAIMVQGGANLRIAHLRHVAAWIEWLEQNFPEDDLMLTNERRDKFIKEFREQTRIPEAKYPDTSQVDLFTLWNLCIQEHAFARLSTLVQFMRELQIDELERLIGSIRPQGQMVVSTIHKVKGLEFDEVIILPSALSFGAGAKTHDDLERDAAEEARLLYVAMTRAKSKLFYFVGEREYAWGKPVKSSFEGERMQEKLLGGSLEDVGIGWASTFSHFNPDPDACQEYIEQEVGVGDPIFLGGSGGGAYKVLIHKNKLDQQMQVGFLAKTHGSGGPGNNLRVSAVVRYRFNNPDEEQVSETVRQRGWGYVVLISGKLR